MNGYPREEKNTMTTANLVMGDGNFWWWEYLIFLRYDVKDICGVESGKITILEYERKKKKTDENNTARLYIC